MEVFAKQARGWRQQINHNRINCDAACQNGIDTREQRISFDSQHNIGEINNLANVEFGSRAG